MPENRILHQVVLYDLNKKGGELIHSTYDKIEAKEVHKSIVSRTGHPAVIYKKSITVIDAQQHIDKMQKAVEDCVENLNFLKVYLYFKIDKMFEGLNSNEIMNFEEFKSELKKHITF